LITRPAPSDAARSIMLRPAVVAPYYNNSNAAAWTALESAGLDPRPDPDMATWLGE
jgi:hypothetical protein